MSFFNPGPVVGIIIPTYNRLRFLTECIDSIRRHCKVDYEMIVVDGGSTDGTIEFLEKQADIRSIFEGKLTGGVNAVNAGFAVSGADYVCTLNDDCLLHPNGLEVASRVLSDNPDIGLVGLKTFEPDSENREAAYIGAVSRFGFVNQNFFLIRRDLMNRLGGFCTEYEMYGSDLDLTASVLAMGFKVVTTKMVVQYHMKAWESLEKEDEEAQKRRLANRDHGRATFQRRFGYVGLRSTRHRLKGVIGRLLIATIYRPSRGRKKILALTSRDIRNITRGRYISLLDPILQIGKTFHLVQRPTRLLMEHPDNPWPSTLKTPVEKD